MWRSCAAYTRTLQADICGSPLAVMLALNTCRYARLRRPSHVSITNSVEKMFASFAPYPLRPPVT